MPAHFPWEVPVRSDALVAGALTTARPAALRNTEPRLNGLDDDEVAKRYQELRAMVLERASSDVQLTERLKTLEVSETETSWTRWQTALSRSGADDDVAVVEAARRVWEALGPNVYAIHLTDRPRTYRGWLEGRLWLIVTALGLSALVLAAIITDEASWFPWWGWTPAVVAWPLLVWRVLHASYRAREQVGRAELPYL